MEADLFAPEDLQGLQDQVGYHFHEESLLKQALIHRSYVNESQLEDSDCNERLEFLGDAVLELVVSDCLYRRFPNIDEGDLTKKRVQLVCEASFAYLGKALQLPKLLLMGKGEENQGGREKNSIAADSFEALCGAIYLDGGYDFIYAFWSANLDEILAKEERSPQMFHNYKSKLQEYLAKEKKSLQYERLAEEGPANSPSFLVGTRIDGRLVGQGWGKSVKAAEQAAAREALKALGLEE